jgi:hypothetical protein
MRRGMTILTRRTGMAPLTGYIFQRISRQTEIFETFASFRQNLSKQKNPKRF